MSTLPSVLAAENFHAGKPGGLLEIIGSTFGRACIIGSGIFMLTGERDPKRLAYHAAAGAVAIELFVLYYTSPNRRPNAPASPAGFSGLHLCD